MLPRALRRLSPGAPSRAFYGRDVCLAGRNAGLSGHDGYRGGPSADHADRLSGRAGRCGYPGDREELLCGRRCEGRFVGRAGRHAGHAYHCANRAGPDGGQPYRGAGRARPAECPGDHFANLVLEQMPNPAPQNTAKKEFFVAYRPPLRFPGLLASGFWKPRRREKVAGSP